MNKTDTDLVKMVYKLVEALQAGGETQDEMLNMIVWHIRDNYDATVWAEDLKEIR